MGEVHQAGRIQMHQEKKKDSYLVHKREARTKMITGAAMPMLDAVQGYAIHPSFPEQRQDSPH